MFFGPGSDLRTHFGQQDERIFIKVCTDCKPRANNRLFRGEKGVLLERC
jgi:hypothetical protein